MNLKDILAISGEGTLFKFVAQGKNAVIVENLETGRRFSAGASAKVSALDEIALFTTGEDIPLAKVMDLIWERENGGETISHKLPDTELKNYFAAVLPDYDRDRVYTSDIKKVLHWYGILHRLGLLVKEEEKPAEPVSETGSGKESGSGEEPGSGAESGTKSGSGAESGTKSGSGAESGTKSGSGAESGTKSGSEAAGKASKKKSNR